ncbi:MAG TPA: hypothetical protein VFC09_14230 [Candidatus Dormibacteraeota bacterium]|nr:hypothetical protein [Candidatus Dormibacteraeota bacterium]
MSAAAGPAGLLVDVGAAQRPGTAGAGFVEECAAALLARGDAVRALLLDPGAPIPGTLHSRVLGSGLLRWNTASEVRRARSGGPCVYVTFGEAAVPPHVERLGVPVVVMATGDAAPAEVAERVVALALRAGDVAAAGPMRVAFVAAASPRNRALAGALARRCEVDTFAGGALAGTVSPAEYDGVVHALSGDGGDLEVLRSARRLPGVLWLHEVSLADVYRAEARTAVGLAAVLRRLYGERAPAPALEALDRGDALGFDPAAERRYGLLLSSEVVRGARAVVVPDERAARRLRLDQGAGGPCPPISVCDVSDPDAAATHLLSLLDRSGEAAA